MKNSRLVWLILIFIFLFMVSLPVASNLEERDRFCTSCHTIPEETYYQRAQQALVSAQQAQVSVEEVSYLDLASAHYAAPEETFRCIDCHRGNNTLLDRARTLFLGGRDTLIWLSGQADPTIEKQQTAAPELLITACINCHNESLLVVGFNDHFHNMLPAAYQLWQAGGQLTAPPDLPEMDTSELHEIASAVTCLDCHIAHRHQPGSEFFIYLDIPADVFPACVQCHIETGKGPQSVQELGG